MTRNARFWIFTHRGDLVRITLRPGQSLTHATGGPTDEGWGSHAETWTHEGDYVSCQWRDDGCDCDGRLTSGGNLHCALEQLSVHPVRHADDGKAIDPTIFLPDWDYSDRWMRDHQAEAAGY